MTDPGPSAQHPSQRHRHPQRSRQQSEQQLEEQTVIDLVSDDEDVATGTLPAHVQPAPFPPQMSHSSPPSEAVWRSGQHERPSQLSAAASHQSLIPAARPLSPLVSRGASEGPPPQPAPAGQRPAAAGLGQPTSMHDRTAGSPAIASHGACSPLTLSTAAAAAAAHEEDATGCHYEQVPATSGACIGQLPMALAGQMAGAASTRACALVEEQASEHQPAGHFVSPSDLLSQLRAQALARHAAICS